MFPGQCTRKVFPGFLGTECCWSLSVCDPLTMVLRHLSSPQGFVGSVRVGMAPAPRSTLNLHLFTGRLLWDECVSNILDTLQSRSGH